MEISLDLIVKTVVEEVVKELVRQGVSVVNAGGSQSVGQAVRGNLNLKTKSEVIDMEKYKTPVLTERHLMLLHELTGEVVVPSATIVTPKAKELLKEKGISVRRK